MNKGRITKNGSITWTLLRNIRLRFAMPEIRKELKIYFYPKSMELKKIILSENTPCFLYDKLLVE